MRSLDRKLLRDLTHLKGQVLAIVLVIAAGVGTLVMSLCAYESLERGKETFYREYRFADVFASARRFPEAVLDRIKPWTEVAAFDTRLVYDVLIDVPNLPEPATGRLISIPDSGEQVLNRIYISRGRMIEPGRNEEVVISEMFADANGFVPGDEIEAIINGRLQPLRIVGVALCPEYVIQLQAGGSSLPDKKRFGIFWMNHQALEAAFDMSGAYNSLAVKLSHDGNVDELIARLDRLLEPYGSMGAYDRSEQMSHQFVTDELFQLRVMAMVAPTIFFSVAAFLLNIVVSRIISQQREQIAALKAFGYTHVAVGSHYLSLVLIITLAGTAAGVGLGYGMGNGLARMYQEFYKFPELNIELNALAVLGAFLLTTGMAVLGTWFAVRRAIRLPPAEAMRPEPPPDFRTTRIEKYLPLQHLPQLLRMMIRNVTRRPIKSAISIFGIGMAVAVLVLGSFTLDALNYLIEFQFEKSQRQDLMVTFVEPATAEVVHELANLEGVQASETMRSVPARLRHGHHRKRVGVMGLTESPKLFRLLDDRENPVPMPAQGLMLNTKLAEILDVQLGDTIRLEVLDGKRPVVDVEVTSLVNEFGGTNAYMKKEELHRLLKESEVASGGFLKVDPWKLDDVYQELRRRPVVAGVDVKAAAVTSFRETVGENMLTMRSFNIIFAVFIAIGVVYNTARISFSEQSRNLATMRVIGFTQAEVSTVLLGELALFTLIALPVGSLTGYLLAWGMVSAMATENYRIPLVVSQSTYALAYVVVVVAAIVSGLLVQRRIFRLDLIGALKTRD